MPVTAVNLLHERRASGLKDACFSADRGARWKPSWTTAHARPRYAVSDRQAQPQPDDSARIVAFVVIEVRRSPLIRDCVIKTSIAVDVRCCDPTTERWLVQRELCGDVVKTTVR